MSYDVNKIQSPSQNITNEIDMKSFIFYWKMRKWKTINAIRLALDKRYNQRIYSNVDIFQNWKSIIRKLITTYAELDKIRFSYTHGIIIIDEAWINANSKDTRSEDNRLLQKILFLAWKKNCSVIWISQRFESIDINARVLADYIIKVNKISREWTHPIFTLTKERQVWSKLIWVQKYINDTISEFKQYWITYNTLEESVMKKAKTIKQEEKENDLLT